MLGEQNKSEKLKIQELQLFQPAKPQTWPPFRGAGWCFPASCVPRPAEEKRSKVPPFSLQTRGPQQGHQTQILLTGTTGRSTQKCRCSPCFLLKTHNYQLNWAAAAGTPPLPTQGGQTFVVNSLPGRKTIFLKRNNLFRMKQNQLNCERMFE